MLAYDFECRRSPRRDIGFAAFHLVARSRTLTCDGQVVSLGSRAFDLLHCLARSAGTVIEKEELVREVWPTTIVEESNLRFQMASLRKALGQYRNLIKTIPGRGYLFTGECFDPEDLRSADETEGVSQRPQGAVTLALTTATRLRALVCLLEKQIETLEVGEPSEAVFSAH